MQMSWFDIGWPFVGLGGAIVMIAVMLMTDTFRGNTAVSRWRDPVWLGWLGWGGSPRHFTGCISSRNTAWRCLDSTTQSRLRSAKTWAIRRIQTALSLSLSIR